MKEWSVNATVIGGKHIGVFKAATGEEAIALALGMADVSFCHQCSEQCDNAEATNLTAECDGVVVEESPEESWEDKARKAGWKPPRKES